ncbi:MAG: NUDIX hydrolase [Porticoccaceae bacterium]
MPDQIHLTVATVIHRDGKFLMVRERDRGREVINQPAGHVEPGETLQQAALRETYEETGWRVELTDFLGISTYHAAANGATYYRVSFAASALGEDRHAVLDPDIIAAHWLTPEALRAAPELLRSPLVMKVIDDFLAGRFYPLDLVSNLHHGDSA